MRSPSVSSEKSTSRKRSAVEKRHTPETPQPNKDVSPRPAPRLATRSSNPSAARLSLRRSVEEILTGQPADTGASTNATTPNTGNPNSNRGFPKRSKSDASLPTIPGSTNPAFRHSPSSCGLDGNNNNSNTSNSFFDLRPQPRTHHSSVSVTTSAFPTTHLVSSSALMRDGGADRCDNEDGASPLDANPSPSATPVSQLRSFTPLVRLSNSGTSGGGGAACARGGSGATSGTGPRGAAPAHIPRVYSSSTAMSSTNTNGADDDEDGDSTVAASLSAATVGSRSAAAGGRVSAFVGAAGEEWRFTPPPDNHRTFYFPEDDIEFSSDFDTGNLIQVERKGTLHYLMYSSMDCGNAPTQTNNRQWFHFSVRGGSKGATVLVTFIGMLRAAMFTWDWMPVVCHMPNPKGPQYTRIPGASVATSLDLVPPTPGYPALVYRNPKDGGSGGGDDGMDDDDGEDGGGGGDPSSPDGGSADGGVMTFSMAKKPKRKLKKKPLAMNLTFEFRIDGEYAIDPAHPVGDPATPAMYIASNHPYSYGHLRRSIAAWESSAHHGRSSSSYATPVSKAPSGGDVADGWVTGTDAAAASAPSPPPPVLGGHSRSIFFHREVLCKTLEGRDVDLLTVSDQSGMLSERMPLISTEHAIPHSSARGDTARPPWFTDKPYVVLSARVHSGECPGSHMMHGAIDFLLNHRDSRAQALRQRFVFVLVPMLNPDGVVRGHSRVDAAGEDLNRTYRDPSPERHPSTYALWHLLMQLADARRLAVYVDMHAHANKKGTFFYGNGMNAADQVQNLLYGRLVSLNTPYFDFRACNYSESNMFAIGKGGRSKDSSCRVVLYQRTGLVHSYAIETSHVSARNLNAISTLAGVDELEVMPGTLGMQHGPATFGDTGKALLVALLDLKGFNPVSRLPLGSYGSARGLAMSLHRQLQIEAAEKIFALAYKRCADRGDTVVSDGTQSLLAAYVATLAPSEYPEKLTVRDSKVLPPVTFSHIANFVTPDVVVTLLAQTPPPGPPRTFVSSAVPRRSTSSSPTTTNAPPFGQGGSGGASRRSASRSSKSGV